MKWQIVLPVDNLIKFYSSVYFSHRPAVVSQKSMRENQIGLKNSFSILLIYPCNLSPHKSSRDFTGTRLFMLDYYLDIYSFPKFTFMLYDLVPPET